MRLRPMFALTLLVFAPLMDCGCEDKVGPGYDGYACAKDADCRGTCGGDGVCVDSGIPPSYDGAACTANADCNGTCGPDGVCVDSGLPPGWNTTDGGQIQVQDGGVVITDPNGEEFVCYPTTCNDKLLECGNCLDDDGDGFTDWRDRECLGPCDNTEGPALTAGVGGETGGPCKADCYFDFGNGSGNDDCHWDHRCDPLSVAPNFNPEGQDCALDQSFIGGKDCPATQSDTCNDFCPPLTPNGCDCFGCCIFPELVGVDGGADRHVWIGSADDDKNGTCTFADIEDPTKCRPCTPVANCWNECGRCEVCIGKPDVPADCFVPTGGDDMGPTPDPMDGGTPPPPPTTNPDQCPAGIQACGLAGQANCELGFYCVSGCCRPVPD